VATGCDWYPTLMELCEIPPSDHPLDGRSLLPIIRSEKAPTAHQRFHWKSGQAIAVREGRWKLIMTGKRVELYDLPNDLGESQNLAEKFPEIVTRLQEESQSYWRRID